MALFESYERRIDKINGVLAQYGISSVEECREKDMTYQAPLLTDVRLTNKETGEIKEQLVFMGDFPMMTDQGTFIINGTERIVVSQLVRSPGVYYSSEMDSGKQIYKAQIIPSRGAWLEFEVDKRDQLMVSIDRKRKQSATMFLRALGIAVTNDDIIELLAACRERDMLFVQISGLEDNEKDAVDAIYKDIEAMVAKISKIYKPESFNMHVSRYNDDGDSCKYSISARLFINGEAVMAKQAGWDLIQTSSDLITKLEDAVINMKDSKVTFRKRKK